MPLLTIRRSQWLPGVAVVGAAVGVAAMLGIALGARHWAVYALLVTLILLGLGGLERLRERRRRPVPRPRGKLKVIRGGRELKDYDLADDDATDHQRYLM